MEDYSKVAVVKRNNEATLEKVRGAIRPTSLLWREACSAHSKIKRKKTRSNSSKSFWKKGCDSSWSENVTNTLPLSEHSNIQ